MKYNGRIKFLIYTFIFIFIESFFSDTIQSSIPQRAIFIAVAFFAGWYTDKAQFYRSQAEANGKMIFSLIENSPEPIMVYQDEKIVFINNKFEELVQSSADRIIGTSIFDMILPNYHALVKERVQEILEGKTFQNRLELKIYVSKRHIIDIDISSALITYENKPAIEVILRDVTVQKQLEEELRKNEQLYRFVTENSTDIISYVNPDGIYEYISPSCEKVFGYQQEELIGQNMFYFFHEFEMEDIEELVSAAKAELDFTSFSHRYRRKDESYIWVETNARAIRNSGGKLEAIVAVTRDITERVEKENELKDTNAMLRYLSNMDGLTGIPNRRYFEDKLQEEWNRTQRNRMPLSALMMDIDYFKKYNDHYGHLAGDECIKEIAKILSATLKRPGDFAARYGGEEFVVLLPETDAKGAAAVAQFILDKVRKRKIKNEGSKIDEFITISIGCASLIPNQDLQPEDLIRFADLELYRAKKSGKNQVKTLEHTSFNSQ